MLEFEVPLCKDDLTSDRWKKSSWYYVTSICNIDDLPSKVSECQEALENMGIQFILEHFDTLFSFLIHFNNMEQKKQFNCWTLVSKALGIAIKELDNILSDNDLEDSDRVPYLNATKMLIYIFTQSMISFEDSIINIGKVQSKKVSKKLCHNNCDWREKFSNEALIQLYNLIQLPIQRLWNPPCCEQSFTEMIGHACFKVLEDVNTVQVRLKHICETIFQIIGTLVKKHNFGLSCVVRIGQMLNLHEHSVSQLVKCVLVLMEEFECQRIVSEIMEEVARLDPGEPTTTSLSAKTYAQFIMEITSEVPSQILEHIKKLEIMLSGESYTIRNGVLSAMGEILLKCLSYENLSDDSKKKRDNILNHLEDHIYDVNAFVRTKTLQIWKTLLKGRGIPLSRQSNILEKAVGRLKDKSVFVKKSAVQLVSSFLEENPFAAKLNLEELKAQLNMEEENLNVLNEKEKNSQSELINEIENNWVKIREQLVNVLPDIFQEVNCDAENGMEIDEDNDMSEICNIICEHLSSGTYLKAYSYLRGMEQNLPSEAQCLQGCVDNEELLQTCLKMFHKVYVMYHTQKKGLNGDSYIINESETPLQKEIREQVAVIDYLKDSINFVILMDKALPDISQFLNSQQSSEVVEAIDFFCRANQFGFSEAEKYMKEFLVLVLSDNENITKAVANAYQKVYFSKEGLDNRGHATQIVKNLCKFISSFTLVQKTALDCLINEWLKTEVITYSSIQVMWEWVAMKENKSSEDSRNALIILEIISKEKPEIMNNRIPVITALCLGERGLNDFCLVSTACRIIGNCSKERLPDDHAIFCNLRNVLYSGFANLSVPYYNKMASDAIEMVYKISLKPVIEMEMLIKNLTEQVQNSQAVEGCSSGTRKYDIELMSRLIFVVGHVAFRHMIHLQDFVYINLKKKEQSKKQNKKRSKMKNNDDGEEDECTQANDEQLEQINCMCENEVVSGKNNLLSVCSKVIIQICSKPGEYNNTNVLVSAFLALSKMMMISSEFCSNNIQLFMTALKDAEDDVIRMNCLIAVGDIAFRFPNIIEPWTVHLSASLLDKSVPVRTTAVMVLTHLIINDMVKIKGQVTELAMCIVDEDKEISHAAKVFFSELSQKGNTLYNALPDIISKLSNLEIYFDSKNFCTILKFILGLVQRERQLENLVEKLCQRLGTTSNDKQAEDISYCMSLLSYNEKSLRFLLDNITCYGDKLRHKPVLDHFNTIMSGVNNNSKMEVKALCDELEFHIQNIVLGKTEKVDDGSLTLPQYNPPKTPHRRKGKYTKNPKSSTKKLLRKRIHKTTCSESEDSDN